MRRVLIVAGLLLLVAGFAVGPAAAVTPPSPPASSPAASTEPPFIEGPVAPPPPPSPPSAPAVSDPDGQARQPVVRVTPESSSARVCTSVTFTITVENGDSEVGDLAVKAVHREPGPVAVPTASVVAPTTATPLEVEGKYPTFTVTHTSQNTGTDSIEATWSETNGPTAKGSAVLEWQADDSAGGTPTVELDQPGPTSTVGEPVDLQIRVGSGSRCGKLTLLVNGVDPPAPLQPVDDTHYTARYTREQSGADHIEAVWRQPAAETVSAVADHAWIPVVRIAQSSESSPRGAAVGITVSVVGGGTDGALAITVTGDNPRTLTPTRVENTFTAEYTGTVMGRDTITAVWTQKGIPPATAVAVHSWGEARPLDLVASTVEADLGAPVTLTAHFNPVELNVVRAQATPLQVRFLVTGANPDERIVDVVGNVATWTYTGLGTRAPTDAVQAFIVVRDGQPPASNVVTVTWRTPIVTLTQDTGSAIVGQERVVTATVAGAVGGSLVFAVDGVHATAEKVQSGTHPTYTLRYRGAAAGQDRIVGRLTLGGATFTSAALPVDWVVVRVTLDQATTVSQIDRDLVLTATLTPPQTRGAVVFTATGAGDPVTVRDDSADGGFTATLRRPAAGVDTITATWADAGAQVTSAPIRHEWRPEPQPALLLGPGGTTSCAGNPFDLTLSARSGDTPVANLPVQLAVSRSGAPTRAFTGTTDSAGVLPLTYTAEGAGADTLTATATIDGTAVTSAPMTHTWQSCALDVVVDSGGPTTTVGSPVSPTVTVRDIAGRPVASATVALRVAMTGQDDVVADLVTDANGLATTEYRRDVVGTDRLTAVATSAERRGTGTAELEWTPGAIQVSLGPAGTSSVGGSPFTVTALVTDGQKPIVGADIAFLVQMSGQDDLGGPPVRTDADGTAAYTWTRTLAGDDAVSVVVVAGDRIGRAATTHRWTLVPTLRLALDPAGTTSRVGTDFTATATVTVDDRSVTATDVAFTTGRPDRPGTPRSVRTDAAGRAALTYRNADAGTDTITATVSVPNVGQGSASITHLWRAADVVRPPVRRPDLTIRPQQSTTQQPTPRPSPGPRPTPPGSGQAAPPGPAVVEGTQCPPGSQVTLTAGGVVLGTVTADADGNFAVPARLPDLSVGRHKLVASCPPVRVERDLDVVRRSSSTGTGAASASTAAAVLSFFVLLGGQLVRWRSGGGA